MAMTGTKDVHPVKFGSPAIDYATGMTGAFALSAALYQREKTGKGQRIDMAMLDVAMILMSSHLTGYLRNGAHPKPHGNRHPHATNGAFADQGRHAGDARREQHPPAEAAVDAARPSRDGEEDQRRARRRPRARDRGAGGDHADAHRRRVGGVPAGAPCAGGRVRTMGEAVADPQIASRGIIHRHAKGTGMEGGFGVPLAAFTFAHGGPRIDTPPPTLGQHNDEIFAELGLGPVKERAKGSSGRLLGVRRKARYHPPVTDADR